MTLLVDVWCNTLAPPARERQGALLIDPLEKIIEERTLKFIVKVTELPSDNLTRRVVFCEAKPTPTAKAFVGRRTMHTKSRWHKVLCSNKFIEPEKNPSHKARSMVAWKPKLVEWKNGGSKLEKWHYHLNAPLFPTFDNRDLAISALFLLNPLD